MQPCDDEPAGGALESQREARSAAAASQEHHGPSLVAAYPDVLETHEPRARPPYSRRTWRVTQQHAKQGGVSRATEDEDDGRADLAGFVASEGSHEATGGVANPASVTA